VLEVWLCSSCRPGHKKRETHHLDFVASNLGHSQFFEPPLFRAGPSQHVTASCNAPKSEPEPVSRLFMYSRPSIRRAFAFTPRLTFSQSKSQASKLFRSASALCSHRTLITGSFRTGGAPVDLRYDALHPNHGSKTERPLVILHGLLSVFFPLTLLCVLANGVTHSMAVG
jgi:hypothetical protein